MNWVWVRDKMRSYPTDLYPAGRVGYGWKNEEQTNRCGAHLIAVAIDRQEGVENEPACAAVAAGAGEPQPPSSRALQEQQPPPVEPSSSTARSGRQWKGPGQEREGVGLFFSLSLSISCLFFSRNKSINSTFCHVFMSQTNKIIIFCQ